MSSNLSGKQWWHANQAKFPNSREISSLDSGFRSRVEAFLESLRQAGATVAVSSTRRNATRAYLMHYSWRIAEGDLDPAEVPSRPEANIAWDHGDIKKSRDAAREMVNLFNMAHIASLTSNHITGKAIDMTISWKDTLVLTKPAPLLAKIESRPRTGENRDLQALAADVFGVRKLPSDPPHWSHNGR